MRAGKRLRPLPISPPSDEQESISNTNPVHRVHPFLVPEPVVDWGPPTWVDHVLARVRDFFVASGPWGWVGYAVLAVSNGAKRAYGFHNMAGYVLAFGCDDLIKSGKLPDQINSD